MNKKKSKKKKDKKVKKALKEQKRGSSYEHQGLSYQNRLLPE